MSGDGESKAEFHRLMKYKLNRCLSPTMDCPERAIKAHSVQKATAIALIEEVGHVYQIAPKSFGEDLQVEFQKVGRHLASVFTGMCSSHDTTIFRPIDTKPIDINDNEQLFLLAYRSATRELHAALEAAMHIEKLYQSKIDAKELRADIPSEVEFDAVHAMFKAWLIWKYRYKHYDAFFPKNSFDNIIHSHFMIQNRRPVVASSSFFTTDDRFLQKSQPWLALNVIPTTSSDTLVLFSYPKMHSSAARKRIARVMLSNGEQRLLALSTLMLDAVENFFFRPSHVDEWSSEKKAYILKNYISTVIDGVDLKGSVDFMLF